MAEDVYGQLPRLPKLGERAFADHHGRKWLVYESVLRIPRAPPRPCLIFESLVVSRRVFKFPSNWREPEPWALEHLSWGR